MASRYGQKLLKFLFVAVTCEEAFFGPVKRGIADAAKMMNVEASFTGSKGVDAEEMIAIVRSAIDEGIDGVALDIIDVTAFAPIIAEAKAKGIPVVAFNINDGYGKAGNLSGIAQDFVGAGNVLAQRLSGVIKPKSTVLITMHDAGISALEARRNGIMQGLVEHGLLWIETITGHHPDKAATHLLDILDDKPEISTILCTGQADTEGAALAAERSGRPVLVAGFDLSSEILRLIDTGHLVLTIDQQPYIQGFYPVIQLALNLRFGITPVNMDAGACVIDRSNSPRIGALASAGYR